MKQRLHFDIGLMQICPLAVRPMKKFSRAFVEQALSATSYRGPPPQTVRCLPKG